MRDLIKAIVAVAILWATHGTVAGVWATLAHILGKVG